MTSNYSVQHMNEVKFSTINRGTITIGHKEHSFYNQYCRIKASPKSFTGKERNVEIEEFKRKPSNIQFSLILKFKGATVIDDIRWEYKKVDDKIAAFIIIGTDDVRSIFTPPTHGDLDFVIENIHGITFKLKVNKDGEQTLYVYVGQH